jgi:hypothetical protein
VLLKHLILHQLIGVIELHKIKKDLQFLVDFPGTFDYSFSHQPKDQTYEEIKNGTENQDSVRFFDFGNHAVCSGDMVNIRAE